MVSLAMAAGLAGPAVAGADRIEPELAAAPKPAKVAGHVYINAATGERVVTRFGGVPGGSVAIAGADLEDLWLALDANPCTTPGTGDDGQGNDWDEYGYYSTFNEDADGNRFDTAVMWDWGDVPFNSKVCGFTFTFGTDAPDIDGDAIADDRMDAIIYFMDGEANKYTCCCTNCPILAVPNAAYRISEMPGDGVWTLTIDLAGSTTGSAAYLELGDTDGDIGPLNLPDAAFAGMDIDATWSDVNGAGLADFGWGMYVVHWDDGNATAPASPVTQYALRFLVGNPEGIGDYVGGGPYPDPPEAQGHTDAYGNGQFLGDLNADFPLHGYVPGSKVVPIPGGDQFYWWFGGLDCSTWPGGLPSDPNDPFTWRPWAGWRGALYTFGEPYDCGLLDINGDEFVNFDDILAFITAFQTGDPAADLNGDGVLNLADVQVLIDEFPHCQG